MNYLGQNLKYLLKRFATNQEQLAFYVEKKQTSISNWVNEISFPDVRDMIKIHQYFGISLDALILSDLKISKVVTDDHVQEFQRIRKVNGNVIGKVQAVSKHYLQADIAGINQANEPDTVLSWAVMGQLKNMDVKLDSLRILAEKLVNNDLKK